MRDGQSARRVLIVEDEPLIRMLVLSLLESGGFTAMGAGTASEAINALAGFDPDALLVDLDLGEGPGGVEVLTYAERTTPWVALLVVWTSALRSSRPAFPAEGDSCASRLWVQAHRAWTRS